MMIKENIHCNHRARMREKLFECGVESFHDHELLEMLLYAADSRRNTNEMAHLLLERFGSLNGIFSASTDALKEVDGVGDAATAQILVSRELMRRLLEERTEEPSCFANRNAMCEYILDLFKFSSSEELRMLMFDGGDKFIGCTLISRGNSNTVSMDVRKMASEALKYDASSIVLAHNHLGGKLIATREDITLTRDASVALNKMGIVLVDHILVTDNNYTSIMNCTY